MSPDPWLPEIYKISAVKKETNDTITLTFNEWPKEWQAGQFNMLYVFGVGEVAISISGDPQKKKYLTHTIRSVGSVTQVLASLQKGASVGVRGPFGKPWPVSLAYGKDLVILAGGLGLAPLRPVLQVIASQRQQFGRVHLLYGSRTPADQLYARQFGDWQKKHSIEVLRIVDRGDSRWKNKVGVVTELLDYLCLQPEKTLAFLCGPEIMMRFSIRQLKRLGLKEEQIFLSLERNMKCATGFCGHCQFGPEFICKDGPVFCFNRVAPLMGIREL